VELEDPASLPGQNPAAFVGQLFLGVLHHLIDVSSFDLSQQPLSSPGVDADPKEIYQRNPRLRSRIKEGNRG
jgi:hypothetical protein